MKDQFKKVMIFSALVFFSVNFHHPVNPSFFTQLNLPNHVFGTSFATMVFVAFLTSPIWGSLGDRYSRKKTLVYSTLFYGITQILYGLSTNMWHILIMRAVAGVFSGGFMVGLMAMVVDVSDDKNRPERIASYSALMGISMSVGFLTGGVLGYLPIRYVFFLQGISMILVSTGIRFFLGETNSPNISEVKKPEFIWNILASPSRRSEIFTPWILTFLGITLFTFIGFSANNNAFNYYLREQLNFEPVINGIWKAATGTIGLIANLTVNVWLVRKTDLKKSLRIVLALAVFGASMIFLNDSVAPFMVWSLFYFTMHTIAFPLLQNFAVQKSTHGAGFMSGIFNAIKALGEMAGALIAGFAYDFGSKVPFLIAAAAIFIALIFSVIQMLSKNDGIEVEID